jgi:hypothetical protein
MRLSLENKTYEQEFPLPQSPETLQQFLNSSDGTKYKNVFKDSMDQIAVWANKNGIDSSPCFEFYEEYAIYFITDNNLNKKRFVLYKLGIPLLGMIAQMLEDDSRPLPLGASSYD